MQECKESQKQHQDTWKDGVKNAEYQDSKAELLLTYVTEKWDTKTNKNIVGVEETS